jgi:hypothetical protein
MGIVHRRNKKLSAAAMSFVELLRAEGTLPGEAEPAAEATAAGTA